MQAAGGYTPLIWMGKYLTKGSVSRERADYMYQLSVLLLQCGAQASECVELVEASSTSSRKVQRNHWHRLGCTMATGIEALTEVSHRLSTLSLMREPKARRVASDEDMGAAVQHTL